MKKIIAVIGARPQFIKHLPFERAVKKVFNLKTIYTGQHYDQNMSQIFFKELKISRPDYMLKIGSGSHGVQTGQMMIEIEAIVLEEKPDAVVVYGDTNSTLAGALVAAKLHIPLIHIEAGLRSYNKKMPEEVNRVLTDYMATLLFVPSELAINNLKKEGIIDNVSVVGDIMKDLVILALKEKWLPKTPFTGSYYYATLHRPYNTDNKERLVYVLKALNTLDKKTIFSIHPRTRNSMTKFGMKEGNFPNIQFVDPQSYFNNLSYLRNSEALITDSGGMQKEAYWLQKKCVTIRTETEWVETLQDDWNTLLFENLEDISTVLSKKPKNWNKDLYGSGVASDKIVSAIQQLTIRQNIIEVLA